MAEFECLYISGRCDHPECGAYPYQQEPPQPTAEDYCAADGHAFDGWEADPDGVAPEALATLGRCYCGAKRYPFRHPVEQGETQP